jgi:hypothetical protein
VSERLRPTPTFMVAVALLGLNVTAAPAITPDLAKKCRQMAVSAHPPQTAGTAPYAEAERSYFRECVARNGDMPPASNTPQTGAPTATPNVAAPNNARP